MTVLSSTSYETILKIVYSWSPAQRFALIRDLLNTLEPQTATEPSMIKSSPLSGTQDLLNSDQIEIEEAEWLYAAARNPAFNFLHDPAEDIYALTDGQPFHDKV